MIAKLKLALGCVLIVVLASAGLTMHVMSHSFDRVRSVVLPFERQAKEVYVGDEFSLPPADNDLPVYDRYTTRERPGQRAAADVRREASYFYGDLRCLSDL